MFQNQIEDLPGWHVLDVDDVNVEVHQDMVSPEFQPLNGLLGRSPCCVPDSLQRIL